jgi:hypothetical protein
MAISAVGCYTSNFADQGCYRETIYSLLAIQETEKRAVMKTSVGFWDALFGERVTLEIPSPNGSIKKVAVTKKWMEKMEREGKMKQVSSPTVKVNILDPMGGVSFDQFEDPADFMDALGEPKDEHRIEYWTIGEQVPQEQYEKFLDSKTNELYAITKYEDGKPSTFLIQRTLWMQARDAMRNV